jgi:hypothetical protein
MRNAVIQGFFPGGRAAVPAHVLARPAAHQPAARQVGRPVPPGPAFAPPARVAVQAKGQPDGFAIDPMRVGLRMGPGAPLPKGVQAKMEAAFRADFSAVRVHVGPQASRIGAVAFTTGNDIYFAPGRYQPDSVQGQQLLGHELAHVIQQRQGRVRSSADGVAVVQDRTLEAEADRLGARAAAFVLPVQRKAAPFQRKALAAHGRPFGGRVVQRASAAKHFVKRPGPADYPYGTFDTLVERQKMTRDQWVALQPMDHIVCPECRKAVGILGAHVDHYPESWASMLSRCGGSVPEGEAFKLSNLRLICGRCNSSDRHNADLGMRTTRAGKKAAVSSSEASKAGKMGIDLDDYEYDD